MFRFHRVFVLFLLIGLNACDHLQPEIVQEEHLSDGGILRVTRTAGGPVGPEYSFQLSYATEGSNEFKVLTAWERPPGEADIEVFEQTGSIVVLTPPRNVLHVRNSTGRWQHWRMRDMVEEARSKFPTLLIPERHEPSATVSTFDATTNVASVRVMIAGWPIQSLELKLAEAGNELDVISASNPDDPRQAFMELLSLPADTEILTISKDLSGDGQTDVLISHPGARNGKAGNIWSIFVATGKGFARHDQSVSIRIDAVSGWVPSDPNMQHPWSTAGVTTYHPKSATAGTFITYTLKDFELETVTTETQDGSHADSEYASVFRSELVIPVTRTRLSDVGGN